MTYAVNFETTPRVIAVKLSTGGMMHTSFGSVQYVNTGKQGIDGTTFYPSVEGDECTLSWTNDGNKENPKPVNLRGRQGPQGAPGSDADILPITNLELEKLLIYSKKVLDENGVLYLWGKVKTYVATAIANIKLPSKTSDLTNDSGFITAKDVPEGAAASSTVPKMDGTAAAGTETAFARGDHVHPSDTTKVDKVEGKGLSANDYTNEEKAKLGGVEANANNYTLPDASASVKGGVTVGTNVDVSGGKISVKNGTTNQKGVVQLSSATDDTSTTKAATPSAVKAAYDLAAGKQSPATSLAGYGIADAYTKDEVDAKMSSALEYKGSKDTYADLPTTGNKKGDVWNIVNADAAHGVNAGDNVAWNGTTWDVLAGTMDLSAYMLAEDLVAISNTELDNICK